MLLWLCRLPCELHRIKQCRPAAVAVVVMVVVAVGKLVAVGQLL
jgi:hypothetical protein